MTFGKDKWRVARVVAIPSIHDKSAWEDLATDPDFGERWHSIRAYLSLSSFGINANEADAGGQLIADHDELEDGDQDELYLILEGRARFELGSETVELDAGELICIGGKVRRSAWALESPTVVVMVGATPDRRYEVPEWDRIR